MESVKNPNEAQPSPPEEVKYKGIGRIWYFCGISLISILWMILQIESFGNYDLVETVFISKVVFGIPTLLLSISRLQNTGTNCWWALMIFIPVADLFIRIRCLICQKGYNDTKKLDTAGKIIARSIISISVFSVICFVIGWIVTSGSLGREALVWNYLGYLNRL
jgi:uncharacterized membrane protein YhaH (DUF805 family)